MREEEAWRQFALFSLCGFYRNLQKNQIIQLKIDNVGMNGAGVGRYDGMAVFVKNALPGESVNAKIIGVKSHYAFALPVSTDGVSPMRRTPACPLFNKCGGCTLQHVEYRDQLKIKREFVASAMKKAGVCCDVQPTVASEKQLRYRNKMSLPVGEGKDGTAVGLYALNSHRIINCDDCLLQPEWNVKIIAAFRRFMQNSRLKGYDEKSASGDVRHLVVRELSGVLYVTVVATHEIDLGAFADILKADGMDFCLYLNVNAAKNNVILGESWKKVAGAPRAANINGFMIDVHPAGFFQVNDYIRDKIYRDVAGIVSDEHPRTVIDAYSGAGVMTAMLSRCCKRAIGIEINKQASASAHRLIRDNNVSNMTALQGDVKNVLPTLKRFSEDCAVVLDPPRSGCDASVLQTVIEFMPLSIVYISCNPATLARDLSIIEPLYKIKLVRPYDMFPMTDHVETLVLLCRK